MTSETGDRIIRGMHGEPSPVENITTSGTSQESAAALTINETYSVTCSEDCYFEISTTGGTADTDSILLVAGQRFFFSPNSASLFVQVIQKSAVGVFSICKHSLATSTP